MTKVNLKVDLLAGPKFNMGQMTMRVSGVNLESHDEAGVAKATMVNSGRLPCNFRGLLRIWITQLEYSGVRNPVPRRNIGGKWENIKTSNVHWEAEAFQICPVLHPPLFYTPLYKTQCKDEFRNLSGCVTEILTASRIDIIFF